MNQALKILVIQTAFLGDVLLTLPLLAQIRIKYPDAKIFIFVRRGLGQFLKDLALVDDFFEVDKNDSAQRKQVQGQISEIYWSRVYSPHKSLRTYRLLSRLRSDRVRAFEFSPILEAFFNSRVEFLPYVRSWPEALRILSLLEDSEFVDSAADLPSVGMDFQIPKSLLVDRKKILLDRSAVVFNRFPRIKSEVSKNTKLVGFFMGSNWATKSWPLDSYIQLGHEVIRRGGIPVLLGDSRDLVLSQKFLQQIPEAISVSGQTDLLETLVIVAHLRQVVANDSAGQHLAALAHVPVISFFGPTVPEFGFRPWTNDWQVFQQESLSCRPCSPHGPMRCPLGTHVCMRGIQSDNVADALLI